MQFFQSNLSQLINQLQALYLCQNNAYYLDCHISKNIAIIKTFNVSKHRKSRVHFANFQTWVYSNIK